MFMDHLFLLMTLPILAFVVKQHYKYQIQRSPTTATFLKFVFGFENYFTITCKDILYSVRDRNPLLRLLQVHLSTTAASNSNTDTLINGE